MPATAHLAGLLRWLEGQALRAGAPVDQVNAVVDELVDALLELDEFRRGDDDPRRQRTLELAERVARAREAGVSIPELVERFGKKRATIYRLLKSQDLVRQSRSKTLAVTRRSTTND